MHKVLVSAPAKVNLALRVGPPRLDGFHPLDTVFESLDVYDDVVAEPADDISVTMTGLGPDLPTDETNLAVRAALLLQQRFGVAEGVRLEIRKRIPVAAGMAGGSADASATLVACARLWGLDIDRDDLLELAGELGSDVPFSLLGGLAHGVGRGERLTSIAADVRHDWVLLTSSQGLSTPAVFTEFDDLMGYVRVPETLVSETRVLRAALESGDRDLAREHMINDLEAPALSLRPDLRDTLRVLRSRGHFALLSGSGPTIAVLAESPEQAADLEKEFHFLFPRHGVLRAMGPAGATHVKEEV
ncbi:4-(cytidine 5'-diphospho)-2-C-methyl-D-erythritol kinase [Actinomycetaceae bacterium L2_0104]